MEDGRKYPGWEADQEFLRKQRENVPEWYVTAGGSAHGSRGAPRNRLPGFAGIFPGENRFLGKGVAAEAGVDLCRAYPGEGRSLRRTSP